MTQLAYIWLCLRLGILCPVILAADWAGDVLVPLGYVEWGVRCWNHAARCYRKGSQLIDAFERKHGLM